MPIKRIPELTTVNSIQDTDLLIIETAEGTKSIMAQNFTPSALETKSDASSKLDEAKEYTDSVMAAIVIDDTLSESSTNAIQNKAVYNGINNKPGMKTNGMTYTDSNGNTYTCGNGEVFNSYNENIILNGAGLPQDGNLASGNYSHAEGYGTVASGMHSHAEGICTIARGDYSHAEGSYAIATGDGSHAEGYNPNTTGQYSHAEGSRTQAAKYAAHAEGYGSQATGIAAHAEGGGSLSDDNVLENYPVASGDYSHAEGYGTTASGIYSHAEGNSTTASNDYSHAEGLSTTASGWVSHAEGWQTYANYMAAHAEGNKTMADADYSHAEGTFTQSTGISAHAEGNHTIASGEASHAEGYGSQATGLYAHAEGGGSAMADGSAGVENYPVASGDYSHAEGCGTVASGECSHAEGGLTNAEGDYSHAEGGDTTAEGKYSHAEGIYTTAVGPESHAEGARTIAHGTAAHSEGWDTEAKGTASHAEGYYTIAKNYQHASGKYNAEQDAPATAETQDTSGNDALFMIGYGVSEARANAFRIASNGQCFIGQYVNASGSDFAELFEWADSNPNDEDRRGLFVTLEGDKIKLANPGDDYIGIVSGSQAFVGNSASEEWQGKYLTDVFGTRLTKEVEIPEQKDKDTGEIIHPAYTTTQYIINPDYNPDEPYIMRENRQEWDIVGLLGQVVMVDDGTCVAGGYVKPLINGIGTAASSGYRVMKRIDDTHIKVLVK